ncbi:MAG: fibrobacter succinogenes major paralogous domain-containing protein [Dysgonamonadaceae bacterium]|jgi:uncharacterized protein (TIGR02145 family)|nr:fibrobacter succinogenes major paralogous domain-containing protein [Dysgonamonadaceae bacterium]
MKQKSLILVLALVMTGAASVKAQVLIGERANGEPHDGAILDLAPAAGANLGLLLPNVALGITPGEFILVPEEGTGNFDSVKESATGMVVYNTASVLDGVGIYVWTGAAWVLLYSASCPDEVKDYEGNTYLSAHFGTAGCWMTQNLRSTRNDKQTVTAGTNTGDENLPYYYYPNAEPTILDAGNHPEYGLLYTWAAANAGTAPEDADPNPKNRQGICPAGWHLPTAAEWQELEHVIAGSAIGVYSDIGPVDYTEPGNDHFFGNHGQKMKSQVWVNGIDSKGTSNASDANGFDVLLVGATAAGAAGGYGSHAFFWSSSGAGTEEDLFAELFILWEKSNGVSPVPYPKSLLFSVRCKRN